MTVPLATLIAAASIPAVFLSAGCAPTSFVVTPISAQQNLEEHVLLREGWLASRKIAILEVDGLIENARPSSLFGVSGDNPVSLLKEKLDKAADDSAVKAIVLRINSPGGGVTASDMMYHEILRFREQTGKPVIACMMDLAASGGYYIACAADKIYAHPTTVTGSIGVIMITPEVSGLMKKIGVDANVIKSGPMKDSGSPFREMTPQDRAHFQKMIDEMYEGFLAVVQRGRPHVDKDRLRQIADGRVYMASEAKELGLIDELGDIPAALLAAKSAANIAGKKIVVIEYARPLAYRANYYAHSPAAPGLFGSPGSPGPAGVAGQVNLINLSLPGWMNDPTPKFMYLWAPGW